MRSYKYIENCLRVLTMTRHSRFVLPRGLFTPFLPSQSHFLQSGGMAWHGVAWRGMVWHGVAWQLLQLTVRDTKVGILQRFSKGRHFPKWFPKYFDNLPEDRLMYTAYSHFAVVSFLCDSLTLLLRPPVIITKVRFTS